MNGTSVLYDAHGYKAPAQDNGSENKVQLIRKSAMPIQSRRAIFVASVVSIGLSLKKKKDSTSSVIPSGTLIQPIHR